MAALEIRKLGDPVLREPGRDVTEFDDALRRLSEDMLQAMYDAPGVGLAAQQVGLTLRFFVFDAGEDGPGPMAIANPTLSEPEGEQEGDEGCLSIPGLYFPTKRAMKVRLDGFDLRGEPVTLYGEGLAARIFQHETDHLKGTLFIERLEPEVRRQAMTAIREASLGPEQRPTRSLH